MFCRPVGREIGKAPHLSALEKQLGNFPEESSLFHCRRNDFSRWLFARSEIELGAKVRPIRDEDFTDSRSHCRHLASIIHQQRMRSKRGLVIDFDAKNFELESEFCKIGGGSLGGKARGLAFMNMLLYQHDDIRQKFPNVTIRLQE